jgi:hypothetical protein
VSRLPISVNARCDTTDLITLYKFKTEDLGLAWDATTKLTDGTASDESTGACPLVGEDVSAPGAQFISFISASIKRAGGRKWIQSPLPCAEADPDIESGYSTTMSSGAVSFAQPPITSVSVPTFVPRASGGKKTEVIENISASSSFFIGRLIDTDTVELYYTSSRGGLVASGITVKARELS